MAETKPPPPDKRVRVTIEIPNKLVGMLGTAAEFNSWTDWLPHMHVARPPRLSATEIVAWLVTMEAMGMTEMEIHAATPPEWRSADTGPELVHSERRVYEDGKLIRGPSLVEEEVTS